jgi:DNA-binding transcriptional LysR family regulator
LDRLHLITVFVAVVDAQGFSGAARKLGMSPPAVTRAINELESQLGVPLLTRTTRVVRVTEPGARYAEDCRRILAAMEEANESVTGLHSAPSGRLTITAPVLFGSRVVTPIVTEYLQRYPDVNAACLFLDRVVNMMEEGVDVAVRIGELPDSSMRAVRVGQVRRLLVASPAYLARCGAPRSPADLDAHTLIATNGLAPASEWRLQIDGMERPVKLRARMSTTTNESALRAATGDFGIARLLSYQVADELAAGRVITVLDAHEPKPHPVHVVHHEGLHASMKTRAFIDMAVERLRSHTSLQ